MNKTQPDDLLEKLFSAHADEPAPLPRRSNPDSHPWSHWPGPVLLERAAYLRKLARLGDGTASETIKDFPAHRAMLGVRLRSGMAEMHNDVAELFVVLDGRATLVTGGAIADAKKNAAGEFVGSSITGGSQQELRPGDIVHVAPAVPRQILLSGGATLSYLVVRIKEPEKAP